MGYTLKIAVSRTGKEKGAEGKVEWGGIPPTVVVAAGGVVVVVEVTLFVLVMIFVDTTSVKVTSTVLGGNVSLTDAVDMVVVTGMVTVGSV